ncbi:MAG: hypothetical protein OHK0029_08490 [Armatimonadaceae bacterium]
MDATTSSVPAESPRDTSLSTEPEHSPSAVPDPTLAAARSLALPVLNEILTALAHGDPVEEMLNLLTEKALLLVGCASAAVALLGPDRESVTFLAAAGQEADDLRGSRVRLADTVAGQTARTGEPFFAFRPTGIVANAEKKVPALVESAVVVAVFDDGKPVGAFAALNKQGNQPFSGEDFLALSTLASAASVVLANARLRARDQRQSRELSVLYESVRHVSGQLSVQDVLRTVVEQAALHLEHNGIAVFLTNDDRSHLYVAEAIGLSDEEYEVSLPVSAPISQRLLGVTQPVFLEFSESGNDSETDTYSAMQRTGARWRTEPIFPDRPARSGLVTPIRSGEETHGFVLVISQQPPGVFTAADANLMFTLTAQTAVAMENAWLYEDATRRAEEATALYELSQAVTSTLNLSDVLQRVADSVLSLLQVDMFALFLWDEQTERLQLVVARGLPEGVAERVQPGLGEGIPGWVLEFETPTAVQDVAADHRNTSAPLHTEGVVSMTCMPLQVGSATIGVLAALSSRRRMFTVSEMELLYTIANQAAIAIENARMYADVRQNAVELRKYVQRVARALGSTRDPDRVPELVASLTREIMSADRCALLVTPANEAGQREKQVAASVGFRVEEAAFAPLLTDGSPAAWVVENVQPLAVSDLEADTRFATSFDRPVRGTAHAYLGVPLRHGQEALGVLEVYCRHRRVWRRDEIRLLMTFASQAAVALQTARLLAEREQAERVSGLLERLLSLTRQQPPPPAPEVVGTLAIGLNTPIVTLIQSPESGLWEVGPSTIAADSVPVAALQATATGTTPDTVADGFVASRSGNGTVVVGLLAVGEPQNTPLHGTLLDSLLATAANLIAATRTV